MSAEKIMKSTDFKKNVKISLKDKQLRANLRKAMDGFAYKRGLSLQDMKEREELRNLANSVKARCISKLPELLEKLESSLRANGIKVHWAEDAAEANTIMYEIINRRNARLVVKGKSMVSEETELNHFLESKGVTALETDMGEYIVQLAGERPSHIVVPAVHKNRKQIAALFTEKLDTEYTEDVDELIQIGRQTLREKFLQSDVGVSGVNFAVAETGTLVLLENEGNGRMSTTIPPVHIAITGIEKVVENLEDITPLISLLTRSSLGQTVTTYINMISSPRKPGEKDGPEEVHLILLDNGRSRIYADGQFRETLYCIRCAACLNHCPVYVRVGGQAYGTVYPGPIGAILTPHIYGLKETPMHPFASSLCGACEDVCPVKIRITDQLRRLRYESIRRPDEPPVCVKGQGVNYSVIERMVWKSWAVFYTKPALNYLLSKTATRLRWFTPPYMGVWTKYRKAPEIAPRSLHELVKNRDKLKNNKS